MISTVISEKGISTFPVVGHVRRKKNCLQNSISKKVGRAISDYNMIEDGDKVLVAVSGGKDSMTLLRILSDRMSLVPIKYELLAMHIDFGYKCVNKENLAGYLLEHGYVFQMKKVDILKGKSRKDITCFWCSWNRRKALFEAAKEYGCNKIALGHHKDDIAQTILMNLLFEGQISAMAPKQDIFEGKISIIRPLAYVEEGEVEEAVRAYQFPVSCCSCPNSKTSKRTLVKTFINQVQEFCPGVKTNILKSLQRIRKDYLL